MTQYICRQEDLKAHEINELIKEEYKIVPFDNQIYYYDPYHWRLIEMSEDDFEYDYKFDALYFKCLSLEALKLAKDEGYGMLEVKQNDEVFIQSRDGLKKSEINKLLYDGYLKCFTSEDILYSNSKHWKLVMISGE